MGIDAATLMAAKYDIYVSGGRQYCWPAVMSGKYRNDSGLAKCRARPMHIAYRDYNVVMIRYWRDDISAVNYAELYINELQQLNNEIHWCFVSYDCRYLRGRYGQPWYSLYKK